MNSLTHSLIPSHPIHPFDTHSLTPGGSGRKDDPQDRRATTSLLRTHNKTTGQVAPICRGGPSPLSFPRGSAMTMMLEQLATLDYHSRASFAAHRRWLCWRLWLWQRCKVGNRRGTGGPPPIGEGFRPRPCTSIILQRRGCLIGGPCVGVVQRRRRKMLH